MNSKVLVAPDVGEEEFDHTYNDAAQYGRIQFWDDRYADESEPFEWYYPYQYFRQTLIDNIALDGHIMIAGCGTSNMLEDMVSDGFDDIVACDYSRVCIAQMKIRCNDLPEITFFQGNMTDTDLPEESFDAVVDKALFDNMICSDSGPSHVRQYVVEVERLLTETGVFVLISSGKPEDRLHYLEQYDIDEPFYTPWYIEVQAVVKPKAYEAEELDPNDPENLYFIYICIKQPDLVLKKKKKEKKLQTQRQNKKTKKAPKI